MYADGYSPAVVLHGHGMIFIKSYADFISEPVGGFVYGIVYDLP